MAAERVLQVVEDPQLGAGPPQRPLPVRLRPLQVQRPRPELQRPRVRLLRRLLRPRVRLQRPIQRLLRLPRGPPKPAPKAGAPPISGGPGCSQGARLEKGSSPQNGGVTVVGHWGEAALRLLPRRRGRRRPQLKHLQQLEDWQLRCLLPHSTGEWVVSLVGLRLPFRLLRAFFLSKRSDCNSNLLLKAKQGDGNNYSERVCSSL